MVRFKCSTNDSLSEGIEANDKGAKRLLLFSFSVFLASCLESQSRFSRTKRILYKNSLAKAKE